jgi:curli biogenesis system outer membrane secretion channel CsgG
MKKHLMVLCLLFGFAINSISAQSRIRIAVLDFRPGVGVSESLVDGISEMLISSLFDTRRFSIIERTQINNAIQEQGFQRANITTGQIAQVGKILGVEYVLIGIINFIVTERTLENVETGMAKGEYNIDVRIVDLFNNHLNSPVIVYNATNQCHSQ